MPLVAVAGVAGGAAVGVFLLVLAIFPDDFGLPPPDSAMTALELDMRQGLIRDEDAVRQAYAAACNDGYEPACAYTDYVGDLLAAGEIFGPMCGRRDPVACVVAGWAHTQLDDNGDRVPASSGLLWSGVEETARDRYDAREETGAAMFREACGYDFQRGCVELGRAHGWGIGFAQDHRKAFELFAKACEAGEPMGCNWAGDAQNDVLGGDAEHWYERACDEGLADGCRNYSNIADIDHDARVATLEQACLEGDARACAWWADWLVDDEDYGAGLEQYERACESGIGAACDDLAGYVLNGIGVEKDVERALELNIEGCRLGDGPACAHAAYRYMDTDDLDGIVLYLQKACGAHVPDACTDLGNTLADIDAGNRALVAYESACDLGDGEGCNLYGVVLVDGLAGVTPDWYGGEEWFQRSCDLDWGWGCKNLADRLEGGAQKASLNSKACTLGIEEACPGYQTPDQELEEAAGSISDLLMFIGNAGEPPSGGAVEPPPDEEVPGVDP